MPQMSPMWWTTIMLWIIMCLLVMMSINYFNYSPNMKINKKISSETLIWKW
uniref:ATP synthase F0 subunit 8 n=1 Tax=Chanohirata theae TaxID=3032138 RepID=UPI00286A972F|nr:ATP synthase F0 subunit 8 [Chanohirata theae]WKB17930.1 ATP synthase F0 subunit 8 [Chanohirata theae]